MSPYDKKAQQELSQLKKKVTSTKDNFLNKRSFITSILYTLNIVEVQNEKKKTFIFVEEGNNSRMVKEIFRKRSQINFTNDKSEANIIWTRFCDY